MLRCHLPSRRTISQSGYVTMAMATGDAQLDASAWPVELSRRPRRDLNFGL
jgi:hypothetical protein